MFDRRLRLLLTAFCIAALALIGRLFQLQIARGEQYRRQADAMLLRAAALLPAVRGAIVDRHGRVLASDQPSVDLCVHYGALSMSPAYLRAVARELRRTDPMFASRSPEECAEQVRGDLRAMWLRLAELGGVPLSELVERRDQICSRVEDMRRHIWRARKQRGVETDLQRVRLAEEKSFFPILRDLTPQQRTAAELQVAGLTFVRLEPSVRRAADPAPALCHLIGRMTQVSAAQVAADAESVDDLSRRRPGDLTGSGGLEQLAEPMLRGRRGTQVLDLDGDEIESVPPQDGRHVRTTLDVELQQRIYDVLAAAVAAHPPSTGAACAVLSLPQREVLALVSYPGYEASQLREDYPALRDDTLRRPLWPRAVAIEYPPGSIVKPAAMLVALSTGRITPRTTIDCQGRLFADADAWRCWTVWRDLPPHGMLGPIEALQHSCNIFMYTLGDRVGPDMLTDGLRRMIYGPAADGVEPAWSGIGLAEEADGLVPTLQRLGRPYRPADARNYAIGQGEFQITPLQGATLMATIACGDFLPPALLEPESPRTPLALPDVRREHWRLVREGMYRCVNEPGGTAYPDGHIEGLNVCGKTGSAESVPRIVTRRYAFDVDGQRLEITAPTVESARELLKIPADGQPLSRAPAEFQPPNEHDKKRPPTHAWFAGFAPREDPRVAIALVLEYAGSGGKVAAPVGRKVIQAVLQCEHGYLPDHAARIADDLPSINQDAD